jgi:hypothetical protein
MIANLRRRPGIAGFFLRMIGFIVGMPAPVRARAQDEPAGAVALMRSVTLRADQDCLVSLATAIGIANHEGMLSMQEMRSLVDLMNGLLAGLDRPTQDAIAAGDARGQRLVSERVTARLFAAAAASPSSN